MSSLHHIIVNDQTFPIFLCALKNMGRPEVRGYPKVLVKGTHTHIIFLLSLSLSLSLFSVTHTIHMYTHVHAHMYTHTHITCSQRSHLAQYQDFWSVVHLQFAHV